MFPISPKNSILVVILLAFMLLAKLPASAQTERHDAGAEIAFSQAETPRPVLPVKACSDLASLNLTDIGGNGSRINSAKEAIKENLTYCAVDGTLAPSIGFQVLLPMQTWSQRYLQVGCGGLCGRVPLDVGAANGCVPLQEGGFVIAGTDMGHQGPSGEFGRDSQKRVDFAYRAVHLTAVAAKKLIRAFYGRGEAYSYFTGCSDGGREALMEAQRYPKDFNGIIAGAAAMNFQVQNGLYHAWQATTNKGANGKAILVASRLPLLHQAVIKQCDSLDGQADGLIADPRACRFDPQALLCNAEQAQNQAECFSAEEVEVIRLLYAGPRESKTGEKLTIGGPQPGSELGWAGVFVPRKADEPIFSEKIALDALRNVVLPNNPSAGFSLADLHFDKATLNRLRALHPLYDATNPDLSNFAGAGGKLILWHGWADPHISPLNTIAYHEAVQKELGKSRTDGFERLYLFPGMHHCGGGEGSTAMDLLTPMMAWVERGVAPAAIVARTADQRPDQGSFGQPAGADSQRALPRSPSAEPAGASTAKVRSRPVFPYPFIAKYDERGDPDSASSYVQGAPLKNTLRTPQWAGADFYKPYRPLH